MKRISCGIVVVNPAHEVLLCHATGTFHWDIPKGGMDPGETPVQTALRETREESGLLFAPADLTELGGFRYRRSKSLHLFAALTERFDALRCRCSSHYADGWGRWRPEMDGFAWTPFDRVRLRCARHMGELLSETIPLAGLVRRLSAQPPVRPGFAEEGETDTAAASR